MKTTTVADHIEQRLRTWRQQHMNRSGDRLALDDFMGEDSIADLVDFVCDEYALDAVMRAALRDSAKPATPKASAATRSVFVGPNVAIKPRRQASA